MSQRTSATYLATVGGAGITVPTGSGTVLVGAYANGSAGGLTLSLKDSATTIATIVVATTAVSVVALPMPTACPKGIVASCSGTGSYTVFFYK